MSPKKLLAEISWGALIGAFLGCLIGLAEFVSIFLISEASYSGSLSQAYQHVVYPFVALGTLAGLVAAGIAQSLVLLRADRPRSTMKIRLFVVSILLFQITLGYIAIGWSMAGRSILAETPLSVLIVAAVCLAGFVGVVAFRALSKLTSKKTRADSGIASRRRWTSTASLILVIFSLITLPPVLFSLSSPSSGEMTENDRSRPNVILILVDTLRADHLSVYGYTRRTTPNLEEFAERAVVFTQASAASSWTKPSVATIFSSLYPVAHKTRTNEDFLSGSVTTLAEALRDLGYVTLGVTANPLIAPAFGFTQGFLDFSAPETVSPFRFTTVGQAARRLSGRLRSAEKRDHESKHSPAVLDESGSESEIQLPNKDRSDLARSLRSTIQRAISLVAEMAFGEKIGALPPGDGITDIALTMVDRNRDEGPLFLYVHYIDPHLPYSPPPPYGSAFSQHSDSPIRRPGGDARGRGTSAEDRDWIGKSVDLYDGEILFVDSQIGRLLDGLESMNLLEDAVVIVTSDHGEEFLDHGGKKHGKTLYQEVLRVPLLMQWPGLSTPGLIYENPVGLVDLMPTILELAMAELPQRMQGRSLVADLAGEGDPGWNTPYFAQVLHLEMARVAEFKIIRTQVREGSEEIYNISLDPLEQDNLADRFTKGFPDLLAAFEELASETESLGQDIQQQTVTEHEKAMEALRALGYLE